jgi:hypothetical protein
MVEAFVCIFRLYALACNAAQCYTGCPKGLEQLGTVYVFPFFFISKPKMSITLLDARIADFSGSL